VLPAPGGFVFLAALPLGPSGIVARLHFQDMREIGFSPEPDNGSANDSGRYKHISDDCRTLSIEQKAKRGEIQPYLKTKNGAREVDLCSPVAAAFCFAPRQAHSSFKRTL